MTGAFSQRRLEWLVRSRGTDLTAWPGADRLAALDLLRRSPEAQAAFAEALAREEEPCEPDRAAFTRIQDALRRRIAPLPAAVRGLCVGALVACVAAGLYLATEPPEVDVAGDLFNSAQLVSFAALDQ